MKAIRLLAVVLTYAAFVFWKQVANVDFEGFGNAIQRLEGWVHLAVFNAGNSVRVDAGHESELAQAHPCPFSVAEDVEAELCLVRVECDRMASVRTLRQML